jgi:hypothetical protein
MKLAESSETSTYKIQLPKNHSHKNNTILKESFCMKTEKKIVYLIQQQNTYTVEAAFYDHFGTRAFW